MRDNNTEIKAIQMAREAGAEEGEHTPNGMKFTFPDSRGAAIFIREVDAKETWTCDYRDHVVTVTFR